MIRDLEQRLARLWTSLKWARSEVDKLEAALARAEEAAKPDPDAEARRRRIVDLSGGAG